MSIFNIFKTEPSHKNATEAVRWHLNHYGSINQRECLEKYGNWRLSGIMFRLKRQGVNFETTEKKVMTRYNIETEVTTYHLIR
jgi:hypothetical protein